MKQLVIIIGHAIAAWQINDKMIVFFNRISRLTEDAMKKKEEHPTMAQESLCKYMYAIFVKKEYSYLHLLTGQVKLDQLPLPMCFETSVKQAFPNPEGRPYTGFRQTCASYKKIPLVNSLKIYLALLKIIYI